MAETYSEMLRRALGNAAGPIPMIVNDNVGLFNYLRGLVGGGRARPPESPVNEPTAPAVSENPPSSFQLAQEEAARRRQAAANQPSTPTVTPAEASTPPVQPAAQTSPANAFLDMLRQRVQTQMAEEGDQRLREIGIGMLRSRSPNFFENLGAGLAAAEEGTRGRTERLRQAAEVERQALAQRAEEEYRREQNTILREQRAAQAPLLAAQTQEALARAGMYRTGRAQPGELTPTRLAALRQQANQQALREIPEPRDTLLDTPAARTDRETRRAERAAQIEADLLAAAGQATRGGVPAAPAAPGRPAAPAVPTITVGPLGR